MKNSDYGTILPIIITSHMNRVFINQKHEIVFGKVVIGVTLSVLKSNYNLYVKKYIPNIILDNIPHADMSDIASGRNVIDVPFMYGPMRNHHLIQKSFGEET